MARVKILKRKSGKTIPTLEFWMWEACSKSWKLCPVYKNNVLVFCWICCEIFYVLSRIPMSLSSFGTAIRTVESLELLTPEIRLSLNQLQLKAQSWSECFLEKTKVRDHDHALISVNFKQTCKFCMRKRQITSNSYSHVYKRAQINSGRNDAIHSLQRRLRQWVIYLKHLAEKIEKQVEVSNFIEKYILTFDRITP